MSAALTLGIAVLEIYTGADDRSIRFLSLVYLLTLHINLNAFSLVIVIFFILNKASLGTTFLCVELCFAPVLKLNMICNDCIVFVLNTRLCIIQFSLRIVKISNDGFRIVHIHRVHAREHKWVKCIACTPLTLP